MKRYTASCCWREHGALFFLAFDTSQGRTELRERFERLKGAGCLAMSYALPVRVRFTNATPPLVWSEALLPARPGQYPRPMLVPRR